MNRRGGRQSRRQPGGASFVPPSLSGLVLWLRADLGITLNGSNVSAWADQSGQGNNVTQGTGAKQPAWSATSGPNSQAGITFNSANSQSLVNAAAAPLGGSTTMTIGAVIIAASVATAMRIVTIGNNRASHFNGFALDVAGDAANHRDIEIIGTAFEVDTTNNATTSAEKWIARTTSAPLHSLLVNGAAHTLSPNNSAVVAPQAGLAVGCADATTQTSFMNGVIAEIFAYSRAISDAEAALLNAYLLGRYAI